MNPGHKSRFKIMAFNPHKVVRESYRAKHVMLNLSEHPELFMQFHELREQKGLIPSELLLQMVTACLAARKRKKSKKS